MSDSISPVSPEPAARGFGRALMLWFGITLTAAGVIGALLISYALVVMVPKLPSLDALINYRPGVPRRQPVRLQHIPDVMKKAVLAIEDARFYAHGGVDYLGIVRAGLADLVH